MTAKALIASNDQDILRQIEAVLTDMSLLFDRATKGEDAITMANSSKYEIIIIQYDLPDMKAVDVLKSLSDTYNNTPKIVIGPYGSGQRASSFKAGATTYIVTPFTMTQLFLVIKQQLELIETKQELESLKAAYERMLKEQAELTEHLMLYNEQLQKEIDRRAQLIIEEKKKAFDMTQKSLTLEEALKDKETLLKEVHHRVKNNMQIISSLLALQMNTLEDKKIINIFKDTLNRIRSMALVHEKLYQSSDISTLQVDEYLKELLSDIMQSYQLRTYKTVDIKIDVRVEKLSVDIMIPCGLIVCELVSNAVKYAFDDVPKGEIYLAFDKNKEGKYELIVADNGKGLPPEEELRKSRSLGWQLINDLVKRKIRGTMEIDRSKGTRIRIVFGG